MALKWQGVFLFLLFSVSVCAQQQYTQTIRGVVFEKNSKEYLPGASVVVSSNGQQFGTSCNDKGQFEIGNVPVGRCNIAVSMLGFTPYVANSILVYSGKETVLEIALDENIRELDEVVVKPNVDKELPLNKMAVVSARMLSSEEANRYAGTMAGDPARMVANFAGVIAANDTRNDIIIRGNSPMGLLWRLDGFDIPNPNHFGNLGSTGGPIGMLNNNQLANSDFYTGAFPAEFGNATSGVFDLHLRNGNNQKHEFLASAGFNGFELGAEGPLSKKTGASYMINGRYSLLNVLSAIGVDFYGGGSIPEYRDVCAKINVPLKNGNLSWIALLGSSNIHSKPDFEDESGWVDGETGQDMIFGNTQLFTGLNYTHRFSPSTRLENRLSYQSFKSDIDIDLLTYPTNEITPDYYYGIRNEDRIAYNSTLSHRTNSKNYIRAGVGMDYFMTNVNNVWEATVLNNHKGNSCLLKAFAQWEHRFNETFSITQGIYGQYYNLNNELSIEPRFGMKYKLSPLASVSFGSGLFSQVQPREVCFYEIDGVVQNKKLKMNKSWQYVLGYEQKLGTGMHLKTEVYYQHLFNIPVIPEIPEESILNFGDDYYNNWDYTFVNGGTGRNYGVELTLEKFFDKNYYFLLTASLYNSKYKGYDGIERDSKFAGNYAFNALFGYEWKLGGKRLLSVNTKAAYIGGKRYVPLTIYQGDEYTYDYTQAYAQRLSDYFRVDLNVNMKTNYKRCSVEWFVELNNLTGHQNIYTKYFNSSRNKEEYIYQYGFMPIGGCRVYF